MTKRIKRRALLAAGLAVGCAKDDDMSFGFAFSPGTGFEGGGPPPVDVQVQITQTALVEAIASVIPGSTLVTPVGEWLATEGITLGQTMKAAGTSPPAVTLTLTGGGSVALNTSNLRANGGIKVEIDSVAGGTARGQATFRVSYNNGSTWAHSGVTTAATYDLDGGASGMRLNFPTGTYGTSQSWQATVETWTSADGLNRTFTNATAGQQPIYEVAGMDGGPCLLFDGVDDRLHNTDAAMYAPFTNGHAFTLWARITFTIADRAGSFFSAANSGSANGCRSFGQTSVGNGRHIDIYLNDSGGTANSIRTTPELDSVSGGGTYSAHTVEWSFESNLSTCQVEGDTANPNGASFTPGTLTPNRCTIGAQGKSTPANFFLGRMSQLLVWDQKLNSTQASDWRTELPP